MLSRIFAKKNNQEAKTESDSAATNVNHKFESKIKMVIPSVLVILISLGAGFLLLTPIFEQSDALTRKLKSLNSKQNEISTRTVDVDLAKARLEKLEGESQQALRYFYTSAELDDLFKILTEVAGQNALKVISFSKKNSRPIYEITKKAQKNPIPIYFQRDISISLEGDFVSFLRFRNSVAKLTQIVDTAKEVIRLVPVADKPGSVTIDLTLRTYSLEDNS